jgi:hypothetical protein
MSIESVLLISASAIPLSILGRLIYLECCRDAPNCEHKKKRKKSRCKITRAQASRLRDVAGEAGGYSDDVLLSTGARLLCRRGVRGLDWIVSGYAADGSDVRQALAMIGAKGRDVRCGMLSAQ